MPEINFEIIVIILFFLSRFLFGGKKKKKPVLQESPQVESREQVESEQPVKKKKPNFIEQIVQQLEEQAKEADRKRREANGEIIPPEYKPELFEDPKQSRKRVPVRTKSGPNRDPSLNSDSEELRTQNKAARKTQLEKVFGRGFAKDQAFEDKPEYSEGRHFDTGHKTGHENDPVVTMPDAYNLDKKQSSAVSLKETLIGLDLKKAIIINEVLGPPAAKRPRQPHER